MKLKIKVQNNREHYDKWLTLFQSGSTMTDREKSILIEVLVRRNELSEGGIKEPFLTKLLFDADSRKIYCAELEVSTFTLANAFKSMREKEILDDAYNIQHTLIPQDSLIFEFRYDNK